MPGMAGVMKPADEPVQENGALRARLSRMNRASLLINESLDFDAVLQSVLDSARAPAAANYGLLTLLDDAGPADEALSPADPVPVLAGLT